MDDVKVEQHTEGGQAFLDAVGWICPASDLDRFNETLATIENALAAANARADAAEAGLRAGPTMDAYLAVCRAHHWHRAQMRAAGIEPMKIEADYAHYPPDDFKFPSRAILNIICK